MRTIVKQVPSQETSDGAGVRLKRSLGGPVLGELDPFLLLDEFRSDRADDYIAGFPDHPHRGFETVTYMLAGNMRHRDSVGNEGNLIAGSVQWMTAGRGIIHSEMPQQEDGLMWGFQLWVNLPAADKMCPPRYQDIPPEAIPSVRTETGAEVRVIAGSFGDAIGPVAGIATEPLYLDVSLPAQTALEIPVPNNHQGFVYPFEGDGEIAGEHLAVGTLGVLGAGDAVRGEGGDSGLRFLVVTGKPIGEPVARYGPFVMNTRQEIVQAVTDFQNGVLA